jgi:glycolate oxidase iron-sulfur subunit
MQTQFSVTQLADANVLDAQSILRTCVHCGFCNATCPTYLLTGDELDGPRGRIYLAKTMLEGDQPPDPLTVHHLDRCLTCASCMTTCPSGVHYVHLLDHARQHIAKRDPRPFLQKLIRAALPRLLSSPVRFGWVLRMGRLLRPLRGLLPTALQAPLEKLPIPQKLTATQKAQIPSISPLQGRVAVLPGCVQQVLRPQIDTAAARVLARQGLQAVCVQGSGCCGALAHHLGDEQQALKLAKANIAAWHGELQRDGLQAILATASGCGAMLKDYAFMLRNEPEWAQKAADVSALVRDVSELIKPPLPKTGAAITVAYHAACSLQHSLRIKNTPQSLLRESGFTVKDIPEAHICCGSAGTYSVLQPELSQQLLQRKLKNLLSVQPQVIASGNIGCLQHLATQTNLPVVHTVELLDWAQGGPRPF